VGNIIPEEKRKLLPSDMLEETLSRAPILSHSNHQLISKIHRFSLDFRCSFSVALILLLASKLCVIRGVHVLTSFHISFSTPSRVHTMVIIIRNDLLFILIFYTISLFIPRSALDDSHGPFRRVTYLRCQASVFVKQSYE